MYEPGGLGSIPEVRNLEINISPDYINILNPCGRSSCGMEGVKACPGVVNGLGTSRTDWAFPVPYGERARQDNVQARWACGQDWRPTLIGCFRYYGEPAMQDDVQARWACGQDWRPNTTGGDTKSKCRTKCFYETRSHGPQDQDFDVILIWR